MNVIVSNEQKNKLESLTCDIIKNISGIYSVNELREMFKDFFYNKIIIDVTALKNYKSLQTYEELIKELDPNKIIFLLPENTELCTSEFLSHLIQIGIYNFTPNTKGIIYLINNTNTLDDVKKILSMNIQNKKIQEPQQEVQTNNQMTVSHNDPAVIIGFKDVTEHAGSSTLIYMLKKELNTIYGKDNVACIEVGREDFQNFNETNMFSVFEDGLNTEIMKNKNKKIILLDLNLCKDTKMCNKVYYLLEPSTIKLSKLINRNKIVFDDLKNKEVILNRSLLNNNDIQEFEKEAKIKVFYNLPPLDERKRNQIINELLVRIGLLGSGNSENNSKIFGLFRR